MAHARVAVLLGASCAASCAAALPAHTAPPAPEQRAAEAPVRLEGKAWGTFRSKRFALAIALPDGPAWRIDDHGMPWLRATHAASSSVLLLRSWLETRPVPERCYDRARQWDGSLPDLQERLVEDRRVKVAGDPGRVSVGTDAADSGFVVAVSASVRKCTLLVVRTRATDPEELASRLVIFAERVTMSLEPTTTLAPSREMLTAPEDRAPR